MTPSKKNYQFDEMNFPEIKQVRIQQSFDLGLFLVFEIESPYVALTGLELCKWIKLTEREMPTSAIYVLELKACITRPS